MFFFFKYWLKTLQMKNRNFLNVEIISSPSNSIQYPVHLDMWVSGMEITTAIIGPSHSEHWFLIFHRITTHPYRQPWGFQENRVQNSSTPSILKVSYHTSLLPLLRIRSISLKKDGKNVAGFLVIESFSSPEEIDAMRRRMDQLLDGFDCSTAASIFSTKNQVSLFSPF